MGHPALTFDGDLVVLVEEGDPEVGVPLRALPSGDEGRRRRHPEHRQHHQEERRRLE